MYQFEILGEEDKTIERASSRFQNGELKSITRINTFKRQKSPSIGQDSWFETQHDVFRLKLSTASNTSQIQYTKE